MGDNSVWSTRYVSDPKNGDQYIVAYNLGKINFSKYFDIVLSLKIGRQYGLYIKFTDDEVINETIINGEK
jgi:hypothetical protein